VNTITDDTIELTALAESELPAAHALSGQPDARDFILHWPLDRHRVEYARPEVAYLAIREAGDGPLLGFFIVALEPDGRSVECRRIVVADKGRGTGKRAMRLLDRYCREVLARDRIWLDVYDFNTRGQRVYEACGYSRTGRGSQGGKTLLYYEKLL